MELREYHYEKLIGYFSRETRATEDTEGSCYGLCALCVLCGKRDDYYEKGGVSREIRATEDTEGKLLRTLCSLCTLWQK